MRHVAMLETLLFSNEPKTLFEETNGTQLEVTPSVHQRLLK